MQDSVSVRTPAKINLYLDILGKRNDGYHFIKTIMQTVSVFDKITVKPNQTGEFNIFCDTQGIPCDESNLVYKAASEFFKFIDADVKGFDVTIDKMIPAMAGLAGGSSNAAGMIVALNELLETELSDEDMITIGENVGADVPFCIFGGTSVAEGVGDILNNMPSLPECYIVIVKPNVNISTPEAYSRHDKLEIKETSNYDDLIAAVAMQDVSTISKYMFNAFEVVADCSEIEEIKQQMVDMNAFGALMSGSGSAVFGIFEKKKYAVRCAEEFENKYDFVEVCIPVESGVEII